MSVHATSWAWKQDVPDARAKLVLLKLADQANDDGESWPSQKKMADQCGMTRSTLNRKIALLVKLGLIASERRRRDNGSVTSNVYVVGRRQGTLAVCDSDTPPVSNGHNLNQASSYEDATSKRATTSRATNGVELERERLRANEERADLFEALADELGKARTKTEQRLRSKTVVELHEAGVRGDQVASVCAAYRREWPNAALTDTALTKWWSRFEAKRKLTPEERMELLERRVNEAAAKNGA